MDALSKIYSNSQAAHHETLNNTSNIIERIKKYETIDMKVLENTRVMDDQSKAQKDKLRQEEEIREIEENFPLYT
jgi:hypothetical protein